MQVVKESSEALPRTACLTHCQPSLFRSPSSLLIVTVSQTTVATFEHVWVCVVMRYLYVDNSNIASCSSATDNNNNSNNHNLYGNHNNNNNNSKNKSNKNYWHGKQRCWNASLHSARADQAARSACQIV